MISCVGFFVEESDLIDVDELIVVYYDCVLNLDVLVEWVVFGISGYCGFLFMNSFNENYIFVMIQVIVDYCVVQGIIGFLFFGCDMYVLLLFVECSVIEVLLVNGVDVCVDFCDVWVLILVFSYVIFIYNCGCVVDDLGRVDGIVVMLLYNLL